jgi:hypothetical protein
MLPFQMVFTAITAAPRLTRLALKRGPVSFHSVRCTTNGAALFRPPKGVPPVEGVLLLLIPPRRTSVKGKDGAPAPRTF